MLRHLAAGCTTKQMATMMGVWVGTIRCVASGCTAGSRQSSRRRREASFPEDRSIWVKREPTAARYIKSGMRSQSARATVVVVAPSHGALELVEGTLREGGALALVDEVRLLQPSTWVLRIAEPDEARTGDLVTPFALDELARRVAHALAD